MGVNERNAEASGTTLYNTLLYLGPDGRVLGKHRKLMPTPASASSGRRATGATSTCYDLPFGRVGGLLCWENYMPLARYTLTRAG